MIEDAVSRNQTTTLRCMYCHSPSKRYGHVIEPPFGILFLKSRISCSYLLHCHHTIFISQAITCCGEESLPTEVEVHVILGSKDCFTSAPTCTGSPLRGLSTTFFFFRILKVPVLRQPSLTVVSRIRETVLGLISNPATPSFSQPISSPRREREQPSLARSL